MLYHYSYCIKHYIGSNLFRVFFIDVFRSYIMLCGYPPFFKGSEDKSETKLLRQIVRGKYRFHENFWGHISEDAKHFVSRLMCSDPRLRLTVEEALVHPWIIKNKSWKYRDSGLYILLKTLIMITLFFTVLTLYFFILSGYFEIDIQDHFSSRLYHIKVVLSSISSLFRDRFSSLFSSTFNFMSTLVL